MNHFARVCSKRRSPRSSPNKSPSSVRRPQSPRNNQFGHQNGSRINKLEPELDQMTAIRNLQEQLNQIQIRQQREVNAHSLKTLPIPLQPHDNKLDIPPCPPPFFISRKEAHMPQVAIRKLQMDTTEICQLSERNLEHIRPAWISKSKDSAIEQIDCEVDTGAGCNVIGLNQAKKLCKQE